VIVIKAGGSAITHKRQPYTLNEVAIDNLARQLSHVREDLILIHGVGSYGHPPAKKYQIGLGHDGTRERLMGLMLTHYWVDELSQRLIRVLLDHGLVALRCRPTTFFVTEKGRIVDFYPEPIETFVGLGIVPVLHGDGPADRAQGFSVLSGDQIAVYLARHFGARKVIFAMDVPGVLRGGELVPEVAFDAIPDVQKHILDNDDASGGLRRKLEEIKALSGTGIPVQLVSLHEEEALLDAVRDQQVGTLIH
jgi:isopentenyl phosphate kinase